MNFQVNFVKKKLTARAILSALSMIFMVLSLNCAYGDGEDHDGEEGDGGGATCTTTPSPMAGTASTSTSVSHNTGMPCLDCHNGGGAKLFTAAGTLYNSAGTVAIGGLIDNVGSTTLTSDSCGNFYTTIALNLAATKPIVRGSTNPNPEMQGAVTGNCNSCHTSALKIW